MIVCDTGPIIHMHEGILYLGLYMQKILLLIFLLLFLSENTFASSFEGLFNLAQKYHKEGKHLEAFNLFRDITYNKAAKAVHLKAYLAMGGIYTKELANLNKARKLYQKLISSYPNHPDLKEAYIKLIKVFIEKNLIEEARMVFKEFEKNFPEDNLILPFEEILVQSKIEKKLFNKKSTFSDKVRVLLEAEKKSLKISSTSGMKLCFPKIPALSLKFEKGEEVEILSQEGDINIEEQDNFCPNIFIKPLPGSYLTFNGKRYRGIFQIKNNGLFMLINVVDLEEYLYGVIPNEVPSNWPIEALKAQAVASRTYAVYMLNKKSSLEYDLFATIMSQVYGGISKENTFTNNAVRQTCGEILTFNNMPALAMFHSNSGGVSAGINEVWEIELPYLINHEDSYSNNQPPFKWISGIPETKIKEKLNTFGLNFKEIIDIIPVEKSKSQRISTLKIIGENNEIFLNGNSFRLMVSPYLIKSTIFQIENKGKNFILSGNGFGHGVGMSQWGAFKMGQSGYNYKEILKFYYPNTLLKKINDLVNTQAFRLKTED
jgi:stage II sporulation protein D